MGPGEVVHRAADEARKRSWATRQVMPVGEWPHVEVLRPRGFASALPGAAEILDPIVTGSVLAAAEHLLAGHWEVLGVQRDDILDPDWMLDPLTGRRAPATEYAFRIDHRDEATTGNVKQIWEVSRHHHLTLLACAWWVSGDERFATVVDRQLRSWWRTNPFLSGIHWTNGIELGVRLISWAWIRRFLSDWPKVVDLFEGNQDALDQIGWHQQYLAAFRSRGTSANNHLVAEAAGRVTAACAFPWYPKSTEWRRDAMGQLDEALALNTFESGVNRELATDYQRFVTELGLLACAEADAVGAEVPAGTWTTLTRSLDAMAAMVDERGRSPRQGDGDEGRGLLVDCSERQPWLVVLDAGRAILGAQEWWPEVPPSAFGAVVASLTSSRQVSRRPTGRPSVFADAGIHLLRTESGQHPEIWVRADGGPHGFPGIAAHAHADALSVEVRYGGVDVLADPGTYCYHGEERWREYFRSTIGHNTVEIADANQSRSGGPFLWTRAARTAVDLWEDQGSGVQVWEAHHDGYRSLGATHRRRVSLDEHSCHLTIVDTLSCARLVRVRLAFHLGPQVDAVLDGSVVRLSWTIDGGAVQADLHVPPQLEWRAFSGSTDPILGWYSPSLGVRQPTTTVIGTGACEGTVQLRTILVFPSRTNS